MKIPTVYTLNAHLLTLKARNHKMYVFCRPLKYLKPHRQTVWTQIRLLLLPLSVTPIRILPVNKRLRNLGRIQFIGKSSSIYTKICLRHKHLKRFAEVDGNSPLQLSSRTHFAKIEDQKLLRKIKSKNFKTAEV